MILMTDVPTRSCSKCKKSFPLLYQRELSLTVYTLAKDGGKRAKVVFFCRSKCLKEYLSIRNEIKRHYTKKEIKGI
jgi:hypothetical protein